MDDPMGTVTSFNIDAKLAPAGQIAGMFAELSAQFWDQPHIPAESIELCRLALAVMHKASAEQAERHPSAQGLSQAKIDAVLGERWRASDRGDRDLFAALLASIAGIAQGLQSTG